MQCEIHGKEMKDGKFGPFCPTPVRKDDSGNVLEWCQFGKKPKVGSGLVQGSQREELTGKVLATMNAKLDKILENQKLLEKAIEYITDRTQK